MARTHEFGPFRLDTGASILFYHTEPLRLGQRATLLLQLLVERAGEPVSKDALIEAAWPGLAIEESNLTVQIAALRKVLGQTNGGEGWIETLPRRGYRYIGPEIATDRENTASRNSQALSRSLALPDKPSIAVLPFTNLGGDPEQDYFADGMVDEIITGLSRIKWLFVIARNSTFAYKGHAVDIREIGRELGVRYVLEGSVRKTHNRVRINCQLVDASSGTYVWSERYDSKLDDIFDLQDEIALSVVGAIEPSLRRAEGERVVRKRPDSLDAYDLVLRSQADVYSGMPDRSTRALVLLERALAHDSSYALAHAYAAMSHHNRFLRDGLREDDRLASIHHARAAIANGQDDALALTFAGFSIGMDGHDRAAAFTAFEAALAISPSTALAYIFGSVILGWTGDADKAIEWGERALRLSPLDPWAFASFHSLTLGHFQRSRYEEAVKAAHRAVQSNPGHSISSMLLAASLVKLGRLDEAKDAAVRVLELQPGFRYGAHFVGVDCAPALAASLGEALKSAQLPE